MKSQPTLAAALVLLAVCGATAAEITSRVKWICPDEPFPQGIGKQRYYRETFTVREGLTNAVARWWCDDRGTVFVDGGCLAGGTRRIDPGEDVTEALRKPGRHVLAVQNENLAGMGGVCLSLALAYADGTSEHVFTSDAWRCATQAPEGWKAVAFDDGAWGRARVHDDALVAPWCALVDMSLLLPPDERAARSRELALRRERLSAALARMEAEPKPVCRIVYDRGLPWFDIGGRRFGTAFYNTSEEWSDDNRHLRRQVGYFRDAGMHLYGLGVDTTKAWRPDGSIDFERAIAPMKSALALDPEARFFYSINTLLPPRWWAERNPNELVGYANAKVELGELECLKNCAAGSAASEVWRRDVCDYQRRLVECLESTPYAKRIFAYRVDWGANHEWHYYGMRGYMPDAGPAMTAAFRSWLRNAYSNDVAALRRAWRRTDVTFETAETPSPEARLRKSAGALRDPVLDRAVIDYERCHAATLRELLLVCNRSVKEACHGRALVGNYGGYFFGMPETAEGWHLENDAVLDSPYVDFQCSPQVYGRDSRMPGGVQYARCLLEALRRRGKLSIQEADNSPTTFPSDYNRWSNDTEGDFALLARDFVQSLCWGCGYWYFDFGQGWYSDPVFAEFFRKLYPIREQAADCTSVAEVLVVGDYESVMFSNVDWPPPVQTITSQVNELGAAGVPFDSASFKDLASGALRPYRVYLFPNFHYATPEKLAVIDRVRASGGRIVWIGTPGTLSPDGHDPKGVAGTNDRVFPSVATRDELRTFFREAGVHVYCEDNAAAVYACASYVALHNARPGRKVIRLPRRSRVTMVYPERREMGTVGDIEFVARGPATTLFQIAAADGEEPASAVPPEGFERVWEGRFIFDGEIELPAGKYLPAAHYSAEIASLPAALAFTDGDRTVMSFAAPTNVTPPYRMHVYLTGRHRPGVFVTKDGRTSLSRIESWAEGFEPRRKDYVERLRFTPVGGARDGKVQLTAGIGQADTRFVTTGRRNRLYTKEGRLYFTFSARGYGSTLGVMSFDPKKLDFRLEGTILFDYGDGLLRNDVASDLFFDEEAGEWRAYVSNFSTGSDGLNQRAAGGLNCAWSKACPLHGISVMQAKSLGLTGMNEDPDGYFDEATGRWRLLVSEFTPKGIRAAMLESERWDGGFRRIAGPVEVDSTGTTIARLPSGLKCLWGSADRRLYVRSYPDLKPEGELALKDPPWSPQTSMNGRVWPAYARLADGTELLLTFDRVNFPGMPKPNWTYGKLLLYRRVRQ